MSQLIVIIVLGFVVYVLFTFLHWYFTKARRVIKMTDHLKSPGRHIFWGSLHLHPGLSEKELDWYREMNAEFGNIYKIWYGPLKPQVVVCHPDYAKGILRTAEAKPMSVTNYGGLRPWLGMGLLISEGKMWQRHRRLLTPAFHFRMLKSYIDTINRTTNELIEVFDNHAETSGSFDVFKPAELFAVDTVLKCLFSFEDKIQTCTRTHPIVRLVQDGIDILLTRTTKPYLWPQLLFSLSPSGRKFDKICTEYHFITRNVIIDRKHQLESSADCAVGKPKDLLDIMLSAKDEHGEGMNEAEIQAEVNTFMFTGHDTTSSALSWTLYALAKHPEHQKRCHEEIREILQGRSTDDITNDDLSQLSFLHMVIKETMRHYTTIPITSRYLTKDIDIKGHVIPKGCTVIVPLHTIHHNPEVWPDPDTFDPERFHPENANKVTPFNFIPFSAGLRNCIAQNFAMNMLKIAVARIVNQYEIGCDPTHVIKQRPASAMKAENGIWLTVVQRK